MNVAIMDRNGRLTGISPVSREPLEGAKVCADPRKTGGNFVICDESIEPGSLVYQGSQRFFFFST